MTNTQILRINAQRLAGWEKKLSSAHATALVLIGVGHDQRSGEVNLCVPENGPTSAELALYLRSAANLLELEGVEKS